jgi:hypothetical protein
MRAASRIASTCRWLGWKYLTAMTASWVLIAADITMNQPGRHGSTWIAVGLGFTGGYCLLRLHQDATGRR